LSALPVSELLRFVKDEDCDALRDVVARAHGPAMARPQLMALYDELPRCARENAQRGGLSDAVVLDEISETFKQNPALLVPDSA
jgi:hypothetical protein